MPSTSSGPTSDRVRVRRSADRGAYDSETVLAILDSALVAHVGVDTPEGPLVLPMLHAHDRRSVFLHGAVANHLLGSGTGNEVCVTVTSVDGLVIARSAFHHSMNYRSVVIRGRAVAVEDPHDKLRALELLTDRVGRGRFNDCRQPSSAELRRTCVMAVPIDEASAKIRTGDAIDEPEDLSLDHWAGVVPVTTVLGAPQPNADLAPGIDPPEYL